MTTINGSSTGPTMATIAGVPPGAASAAAKVDDMPAAVNAAPVAEVLPALVVRPDPAAEHQTIGNLSADALSRSITATADDVLSAGRSVLDVAEDIMREATELSSGIRRCGEAFAAHVTQFAALAQQVSDTMRSTRRHVLGAPEDTGPASPVGSRRDA